MPLAAQMRLTLYDDTPGLRSARPVDTRTGDVVLVSATFGVRPAIDVHGPGVIVEDHTHDPLAPWAYDSASQYTVASLRKTLPLPDGAVLWSPQGLDGPADRPSTPAHDLAAMDRLSGMALKSLYLDGAHVGKDEFRRLILRGETELGEGEISGMSAYSRARLPTLPALEWREAKAENLSVFLAALGQPPGLRTLDTPYAATLVFDDPAERDRVRSALIAERIYPAILWPLTDTLVPGISERDLRLAGRIMSIHCDYRYTPTDMRRVALAIGQAVHAR